MHNENKINRLKLFFDMDQPIKKHPSGCVTFDEKKWKNKHQSFREEKKVKPEIAKEPKKKLHKITTPSVGDYDVETEKVKKKITYDIKIRGKPKENKKVRIQQGLKSKKHLRTCKKLDMTNTE